MWQKNIGGNVMTRKNECIFNNDRGGQECIHNNNGYCDGFCARRKK